MYYVYILKSLKDGRRYIGYTSDLNQRLKQHNTGRNKSIKNRGPFEIIYSEEISDKTSAIKREKQLKRYKGGIALQKLISGPIV